MPKFPANGLPEWEIGKDLPDEDTMFVFRGKLYYWKACDCDNILCRRPLAYSEFGKKDQAMTIRLRNADQGMPRVVILIALGFTPVQIADKIDAGTSVYDQVAPYLRPLTSQAAMVEFCERYGVSLFMLKEAFEEMHDEAMMMGLTRLFNLFNFGGIGLPPRHSSSSDYPFTEN